MNHGEWLLGTPEGDVPLPKEVPHWDYQTVLELAAPVSVDRALVTDSCQLGRTSGLALLVMARSDRTNAELMASRLEVPHSDSFDLAVNLRIEGALLGGRLTLETLLVVTEPEPLSRLAPQHAGSILWRSRSWTDLEGVGTQFPTDTVDFRTVGLDPNAGWQFKVDLSDPEARFMSAARLTLNSGHPAIMRLLSGSRDAGTEQLLRTLNWDVTRQMVQAGLACDDVAGLEIDPDDTTVAGVLRNLLGRLWQLESVATIRQWQQTDPRRIEVHIQHQARLLI
ncbi:hypothetical protein [Intrasporangium sp. YIM S08009]|uniref:hypothetical protein n=1 Tax=Intrasporangium zincisolvens TaxID=3080018 RepID=UPI002B05AB4E|nr:hypothetical protein [Intrasporangium sp. YIM S08009]